MRSFEDNVVPRNGRRFWFEFVLSWPLFIALLTASVNFEDDWADWIGSFTDSFAFDKTPESTVDIFSGLVADITFDDCELVNVEDFGSLDEKRSANGVHRLLVAADEEEDVEVMGAVSK